MTVGRRAWVMAVALVVASLAVPMPQASSAPGDPIEAKRAEANAVAADLSQLEDDADIAVEAYLQAQLQAGELDAKVTQARTAVAQTSAQLGNARAQVLAAAQRAYVHGGTTGVFQRTMAVLSGGPTASSGGDGRVYGEVAIGLTRDVSDRLARTRADDQREQALLEQQLAAQRQAVEAQAAKKADADAAVAAQSARVSQVQGELAELVRQEQIRRQQEEERLAREAAARRAAQEAAARQAAQEAAARRAAELAVQQAVAATSTTVARRAGTAGTTATTAATGSGRAPTVVSAPTVAIAPAPAPRSGAAAAVEAARAQLGVPYRYAGSSPDQGFDCSGLTSWAWRQAGLSLPHSSAAEFASLPRVPDDQLQPGDLVAYGTPVHHIGIYIGNGQMIHAPQTGRNVEISTIYRRDLRGAVRP